QAFNATAVVRHMRRLQLSTSLEGPSQITTTSPYHRHLLLPAKELDQEEDEDEEEDDN
ncbi:hypothetical protein M9458_014245, partial [Cirrhinus mrigala]